MEIQIGDTLLTTTLKVRDQPKNYNIEASFKAPKGKAFVVLLLGVADETSEFSPEKALNDLGWFFQPEKLDNPG